MSQNWLKSDAKGMKLRQNWLKSGAKGMISLSSRPFLERSCIIVLGFFGVSLYFLKILILVSELGLLWLKVGDFASTLSLNIKKYHAFRITL